MDYQVLVRGRSVNHAHIIEVAKKHLSRRGATGGIVEIELVSKKQIQALNKKFRKINQPTDVLSFPSSEFPGQEKLFGTIFLSCDIIKSNAQKADKTFQAEFDFIVAHGLDHLLGIHHKE